MIQADDPGRINPSEEYDFVSWDDEIPNCFWKVIKHVPNHQAVAA